MFLVTGYRPINPCSVGILLDRCWSIKTEPAGIESIALRTVIYGYLETADANKVGTNGFTSTTATPLKRNELICGVVIVQD